MRGESFDPIRQAVPCESTQLYTLFDTLVTLAPDGEVSPMLATAWTVEPGNVLRLKLRSGVTFQDGTKFDAEAVKFNLERVLNDPASNITSQLANVESVSVVDPSTVDVKLKSDAVGPTLSALADRAGMMASPTAVKAAGNSDAFSRKPVGSGPYKLEGDWHPRESMSVRKWDGYWDTDAQKLGGIDFKELSADTTLNALKSGAVDASNLEPLSARAAQGDPNLKVAIGSSNQFRIFIMNETLKPFDDQKVREAIAYAIDRDAVAKAQTSGLAGPAYQVWPKGNLAYNPSLEGTYKYDPAKAKKLLAEAGYPNGLTFKAAIGATATSYVQMGEIIQAQLKKAGINMDLALIDQAAAIPQLFREGPNKTGILPASPFGSVASADPDLMFRNLFSKTGGFNAGGNEVPEIMKLVDQAASTADSAKRSKLYHEATAVATKGVWGGVPLYFQPGVTGYHTYVGGITKGQTECQVDQRFFRSVYITKGKVPAKP